MLYNFSDCRPPCNPLGSRYIEPCQRASPKRQYTNNPRPKTQDPRPTCVFSYNLAMGLLDLAGLFLIRKRPTIWRLCGALIAQALGGTAGAIVFHQRHSFLFFQLLCWWLFLHVPLLLAGAAILLRRARPHWSLCSAIAAGLLWLVALDAFMIEPHWLEVSHLRIASAKVTQPTRIVMIADFQTDCIGAYEREVFRRAAAEKPDILLLAGDYLQPEPGHWEAVSLEFQELLKEFRRQTPAPIFAVGGNVDPADWTDYFVGLPVSALDKEVKPLPDMPIPAWAGTRKNKRPARTGGGVFTPGFADSSFAYRGLSITCIDLQWSRDSSRAVTIPPGDEFRIVMGHMPNFAVRPVDADLLVAGHTHGGQIQLPFVGPLWTHSAVPRSWASGVTRLANGAILVVSRGTGMERHAAPRIRFLCRPELVVIELVPAPRG
jgi:uncharacterized protein